MNIGHKIKQRRKELKLTQVELAQKIKKSSQVVSNWERGYTPGITYEDLRNLSMALSVPVEYFMPDNSPEPMENPKPDKRLARIIKEWSRPPWRWGLWNFGKSRFGMPKRCRAGWQRCLGNAGKGKGAQTM